MSKQAPDPFQTIAPTALAQVSGGAAAATSDNEAVMTALDSILDSIKSISNNQSQGGFGTTEMMMFMMMLQGRSGASQYVHAAPTTQPFTCGTGSVILK
jgi:hypothetical protein